MRYDEVSIYGVDASGNRRVFRVGTDGSLIISSNAGSAASVTPTFISTSASGTIAAGRISVSFCNFGNVAGTLLGASFPAGAFTTFSAPVGQTLLAIAYDATSTTYLITGVQ
jgi:hypothetical protein